MTFETFEPSYWSLALAVLVSGFVAVGWRHCMKTQRAILRNTERILAVCESLEVFYSEAVEARETIEVAVAAGIAKQTLTAEEQRFAASWN